MASVYGRLPETIGEQILYNSLKKLPDDWLCYSQPHIAHQRDSRNPDFVVIHKNYGFTVLEVKDWNQVQELKDDEVRIMDTRTHEMTWQTHIHLGVHLAKQISGL